MDICVFLHEQSHCFRYIAISHGHSRWFVISVDFPFFRQHSGTVLRSKLDEVLSIKSVDGRHVHPTLLHVDQQGLKERSEICMREPSLFQSFKFLIKSHHFLHRCFPNVSPKLSSNFSKHSLRLTRDALGRYSLAKAVIEYLLPRRSILEAPPVHV